MLIQSTLSSMDKCRKKSTSGDSFSFPSTPNQDSDFEFGSLTPDSPSSDPSRTSPADHLFINGRLQPHSFPLSLQHHHQPIATSRTSSIGSKDSLLSSRSNSTNSRGSNSGSSSARTSSSDSSERRLFHNKVSSMGKGSYMVNRTMVSGYHQVYGCSKRWQYITPAPALNRDASRRRRGNMQHGKKEERKKMKKNKNKNKVKGVKLRFGWRIFRWFVMACRECHAMEPSKAKNKEKRLQKNVNV